jgi:hypothetical protein
MASDDRGRKVKPHEAGLQAEDKFRDHLLYYSCGIYAEFSPDDFTSNVWSEQQ